MTTDNTIAVTDDTSLETPSDDPESDYHPRSKMTGYLHIRISAEDKTRLARVTRSRRQSAAEVVRALIAEACASLPPAVPR